MLIPLRDDGPRTPLPAMTVFLVAVNAAVFAVQQVLPSDDGSLLLRTAGAVPRDLADSSTLTVLSAMFLHGGVEHLLGNLWFLWMFGRGVERRLGAPRYLLFYLVMGYLAILVQAVMTPLSRIPIVGASGAIAGLLGASLVMNPRARFEVLVFLVFAVDIVIVPAAVVLAAWFLWQLVGNLGETTVAIWAHVGGFLLGAVSCKLFFPRRPRAAPPIPSWTLTVAAGSSSSPR